VERARQIALDHAAGPFHSLAYYAGKALYRVRLHDPRDLADYGMLTIHVDGGTGAVRSIRHLAEGTAGDVIAAWQFPLHSGKAFGWPGRILICLSGIALSMFIVTGLLIWARKRSARRSQARRPNPATRPAIHPAE